MRIIDLRIDFVVFSILSSLSLAEDLLATVKCESHPVGYIVPDPTYCDRYLLCKPGGERETRVCDQGQKFDFNTAGCALDSVVICGDRTKTWRDKRQAPKAKNDYIKLRRVKSPAEWSKPSPETAPSRIQSDPLSDVTCRGESTYLVPDPLHCDRFLSCPSGRTEVCNPGLALDLVSGLCLPRSQVDCSNRVKFFSNQEKRKTEIPDTITPLLLNQFRQQQNIDSRRPLTPVINQSPAFKHQNHERVQDTLGLLLRQSEKAVRERRPASEAAVNQNFRSPGSSGACRGSGTYSEADPEQCDKYWVCEAGQRSVKLCPDGLGFSESKSHCDLLIKIKCGSRTRLQPPGPRASSLCPRETGLYPLEGRCDQYVDCREGKSHIQDCAPGSVFDLDIGNCVHPDQTRRCVGNPPIIILTLLSFLSRPGCTAFDQYQFTCPGRGFNQRFGDHDRLAHPHDCSLFFACLSNGAPRLLSCEAPKVFNPDTGLCDDRARVPGC